MMVVPVMVAIVVIVVAVAVLMTAMIPPVRAVQWGDDAATQNNGSEK